MKNPENILTRFAPSPTGYLHLGHVASAIYVWGLAARWGASVLLRIEDHDQGRCRLDFEKALLEDLSWLGFKGVNNPFRVGEASPYRQSDNRRAYEEALGQLKATRHVYACTCSRKDILGQQKAHIRSQPKDPTQEAQGVEAADLELRYPGTCRDRNLPLHLPGASLRLALPDQDVVFSDMNVGIQLQNPLRQCGDLLLRDRHGFWTYQFAVTVDDLRHSVTHVIRGQDLLASTGRQILLGSWLGRQVPARFYHHPLIRDESGRKLGKRFFSEAIRKRRDAGESPEVLLGEAAYLTGILQKKAPISLKELTQLMSATGVCQ